MLKIEKIGLSGVKTPDLTEEQRVERDLAIRDLNEKIGIAMRENQIKEIKSIQAAKNFISD